MKMFELSPGVSSRDELDENVSVLSRDELDVNV